MPESYCHVFPPVKRPPETELSRLGRTLFAAVEAWVLIGDPAVLGADTGLLRVLALHHAVLYGVDSLERVIIHAVVTAQNLAAIQLSGPLQGHILEGGLGPVYERLASSDADLGDWLGGNVELPTEGGDDGSKA